MLTYSTMLPLGTNLPKFELINTINNKIFNANQLATNKLKLIMFICNHCPYVIHHHAQITSISNQYLNEVQTIAISSNDIQNYPEDSPDKMKILANNLQWNFPYLYDETQEIAKKYQAQCTPEFYLFDQKNILIYRGAMDKSSPGKGQSNGEYLREAINNSLNKKEISQQQYPSMGCNIKWK